MHALATIGLAAAILFAQAPAEAPPPAGRIAALIEKLGSESFREREKATDELWNLGEAAEPALVAAAKHTDAEVRIRAASILDRFKQGLYPGIAPEAVSLIRQYRSGNQAQKLQAVGQLQQLQQWKVLLNLLEGETDAGLRMHITSAVRPEILKKVAESIESGDIGEAERLLRFNSEPFVRRQLVTIYVLRNVVPERIATLEKEVAAAATPDKQRLLLALYEASGDYTAADALAAKMGDPNLPVNLAVQRGRWADAAKQFDERQLMDGSQPFNQLAYSAIYHRLAGHDAIANERLENMRALAEKTPSQLWFSLEVLMLNERYDDALPKLKEVRPTMALEIFGVRQDYDAALAIANIKPGRIYDAEWFNALPVGDAPDDELQRLNRRHILALQAAYFLHQVGETKDAGAIFAYLRELGKESTDHSARWRRSELCRIELRLGMHDQALTDASAYLERSYDPLILSQVFAPFGQAAISWRAHLVQTGYSEIEKERLVAIDRLLNRRVKDEGEFKWRPIVESAIATLADDKTPGKMLRAGAIADVFLARGMRKEAIEVLSRDDLEANLWLRGGDLLREDERFDEAAALYNKVLSADRQRPLAVYLRGMCFAFLGRNEEATKAKQQALLLANDNTARQLLLSGLLGRSLQADAQEVRDVWVKTSPELVPLLGKELGNASHIDAPLRAATYWEQILVNLTSTSSTLNEDAGYITLPHSIHRSRAVGHIAAGDRDAYRREIAICTQLLPNEWALVDDMVPRLDKAGWKEEADSLFNERAARLRDAIKRYPNSARFTNGLAWNSAVCRRNLDEALTLAKRTLELSPDNPSYLDTLAEVHFARGEREQAIATQRRVVELAPGQKVFKERLEKMLKEK